MIVGATGKLERDQLEQVATEMFVTNIVGMLFQSLLKLGARIEDDPFGFILAIRHIHNNPHGETIAYLRCASPSSAEHAKRLVDALFTVVSDEEMTLLIRQQWENICE